MDHLSQQHTIIPLNESMIAAILCRQLAGMIVQHPDFETLIKLGKKPQEILDQLNSLIISKSSRLLRSSVNEGGVGDAAKPKIRAREIREALVCVFADFDLNELQLRSDEHRPIVSEMIERYLPSLSGLARHKRHRAIIDACAGRKRGPVLTSRHGKRYIVLR